MCDVLSKGTPPPLPHLGNTHRGTGTPSDRGTGSGTGVGVVRCGVCRAVRGAVARAVARASLMVRGGGLPFCVADAVPMPYKTPARRRRVRRSAGLWGRADGAILGLFGGHFAPIFG